MIDAILFDKILSPPNKIKSEVCLVHSINYASNLYTHKGEQHWTPCPACVAEKRRDEEIKEHIKNNKLVKQNAMSVLFKQAAIPPKFENCNFDNFNADTQEKSLVKNALQEYSKNIKQRNYVYKKALEILQREEEMYKGLKLRATCETGVDLNNLKLF